MGMRECAGFCAYFDCAQSVCSCAYFVNAQISSSSDGLALKKYVLISSIFSIYVRNTQKIAQLPSC